MKGLLSGATALFLLFSPAADAAEALITGYRLVEFEPAKTLRLELMDDSPRNAALLPALRAALTAQGFTLSDDAPLTLGIDSRSDTTPVQTDAARGILSINGAATSSDGDSARAELSLFSNKDDSLLGGPRRGEGGRDVARHHLEFFLSDNSGKRLWQGDAGALGPVAGAQDVITALMAPLIAHIGSKERGRVVQMR